MTQEQKIELNYLLDIVMEASKFKIEDGQDAIRLEVESRIENILSNMKVEGETEVQGEPEISPVITQDAFKALEATKLNEHLEEHIAPPEKMWRKQWKWKNDKVRCQENGKAVWRPLCQCHKEKLYPDNPKSKKFRWVWDGPQDKKEDVNKLSDELWEAHENGDDL